METIAVTAFFQQNSNSYPLVRLLTPLRESLVDYAISLEADVKLGYAKIKSRCTSMCRTTRKTTDYKLNFTGKNYEYTTKKTGQKAKRERF